MNDKLNRILLNKTINENMEYIFGLIPELAFMVGFEHRHPHHHLDVWEHTLKVVENIQVNDLEIIIAGLLHDIGKPFSYQDDEVRHFKGHPQVSAKISQNILRRLGYRDKFVEHVEYLVRTHDTIIDPQNLDNSYEMIEKRLELQYADAKAHAPETVEKRIKFLNEIQKELSRKYDEKER